MLLRVYYSVASQQQEAPLKHTLHTTPVNLTTFARLGHFIGFLHSAITIHPFRQEDDRDDAGQDFTDDDLMRF